MQSNKKYIPARLRQARVSRGLSMGELSNSLDISRQAISQYEVGTIEPSDSIMRSIVDILKYPLEFFKKPIFDINQNYSTSCVFYRKKKGVPLKLKDAAQERVVQFAEIDTYFRRFVDFPEINIPPISINDYMDISGAIDAKRVAEQVRNYWGLGNTPVSNLSMLLEKNGFMISSVRNKHTKIDAFSQWYKNGIPYIFYGSEKQSAVRLRFDLAHELGHLIMHNHITDSDMTDKEVYDRIEEEANTFAGAFLLPESSFAPLIYSTSIDHFLMLKKKWRVSVSAMIYRIQDLGLLSQSQVKYIKDQMTYKNYWKKEPYDDEIAEEVPQCMGQAFELLLDNNLLSKNQFLDDNPYYPEELETMCFLKEGTLRDNHANTISNVIKLKFS